MRCFLLSHLTKGVFTSFHYSKVPFIRQLATGLRTGVLGKLSIYFGQQRYQVNIK